MVYSLRGETFCVVIAEARDVVTRDFRNLTLCIILSETSGNAAGL